MCTGRTNCKRSGRRKCVWTIWLGDLVEVDLLKVDLLKVDLLKVDLLKVDSADCC